MKTHHFIALTAVALLIAFVVSFGRQSALEEEVSSLRAALDARRPVSPGAPVSPPGAPADFSGVGGASRIGVPVAVSPADSGGIEERIAELERVVNAQADFIEGLLAESAREAEVRRRASFRGWGPEQATGAPDTMTAGDHRSAWAPATADGGVEWIEATFQNAADLARIVVRQTCNPGCITKVVAVTDSGGEIPIWQGEDPSKGQALADTPFAVPPGINARRVKVYLDTSKVAGWEEIDAIQAVGRDGTSQWASSVNSSSTYASGVSQSPGLFTVWSQQAEVIQIPDNTGRVDQGGDLLMQFLDVENLKRR